MQDRCACLCKKKFSLLQWEILQILSPVAFFFQEWITKSLYQNASDCEVRACVKTLPLFFTPATGGLVKRLSRSVRNLERQKKFHVLARNSYRWASILFHRRMTISYRVTPARTCTSPKENVRWLESHQACPRSEQQVSTPTKKMEIYRQRRLKRAKSSIGKWNLQPSSVLKLALVTQNVQCLIDHLFFRPSL